MIKNVGYVHIIDMTVLRVISLLL